jgi:hypothetical protein
MDSGSPGTYHEIIGDIGETSKVEDNHILPLLLGDYGCGKERQIPRILYTRFTSYFELPGFLGKLYHTSTG